GGRDGDARASIPTLRMLTESADDVRVRAESLLAQMQKAIAPEAATLTLAPEISRAGGGALPMCDIPTCAVRLEPLNSDAQDCTRYLEQQCEPPIIARIHDDAVAYPERFHVLAA
ncbi:MAG: hypothetical protein Q3963_05865, partial [Coriobacteriaceae bacterium]|nr:hypothetical protein [Coriobacteriaceae bacterium]